MNLVRTFATLTLTVAATLTAAPAVNAAAVAEPAPTFTPSTRPVVVAPRGIPAPIAVAPSPVVTPAPRPVARRTMTVALSPLRTSVVTTKSRGKVVSTRLHVTVNIDGCSSAPQVAATRVNATTARLSATTIRVISCRSAAMLRPVTVSVPVATTTKVVLNTAGKRLPVTLRTIGS